MDKKKQFQIQNNKYKLNIYEVSLNELYIRRNIILNDIRLTSNTSILSSNTKDITEQINKSKQNILNCKYEIVNLTNKLKLLPEQLKVNITQETNINNDELSNLDNIILDAIQSNIQKLKDSQNDKYELYNKIHILENQITQHNNIITNLQSNSHDSRKNILNTLHNKKQQKVLLQQQINTIQINSNSNIYENTLSELSNTNAFLINAKKDLIDYYYSNYLNESQSSTSQDQQTVNSLVTKATCYKMQSILDSINLLEKDSIDSIGPLEVSSITNINDLLEKIDKLILTYTARIEFISQKLDKARTKSNAHIDNITNVYTNSININNIDNIDNKNSKIQNSSYKDLYKIAKQTKIDLVTKYNELLYLYNNYDSLVINTINNDYNNNILELNNHKTRSIERLNIMTSRINNDYQKNKQSLEEEIQSIQDKLSDHNNIFANLNKTLINVNTNLSTLEQNTKELNTIDSKINELTLTIAKIKTDILYLEGMT